KAIRVSRINNTAVTKNAPPHVQYSTTRGCVLPKARFRLNWPNVPRYVYRNRPGARPTVVQNIYTAKRIRVTPKRKFNKLVGKRGCSWLRKIIFQASRSTARSRTPRIGLATALRCDHRLPSHRRLTPNAIAAAMLLPRSTMKKPHHRPKKKPAPTQRTPPGSSKTLQPAKSNG